MQRLRRRSAFALPTILALAACGGDGGTGPEVVSVTITPGTVTLNSIGETAQLQARASDGGGRALSGLPVSWASSRPDVASVSAAGVVTAMAPGNAAVTATVEGVGGTATVTVLEPPASCEDPRLVTLEPGQSASFVKDDCLLLPSGANGDRYRVDVLRTDSAAASSVVQATLEVAGIGVTATPASLVAPAARRAIREIPGMAKVLRDVRVAAATERFHSELRRREVELVRSMDAATLRRSLARTRAGSRPFGAAALRASPERIVVDTSTPTTCNTSEGPQATGLLLWENDDVAFYQDSVQRETKPVTVEQVRMMGEYYTANGKEIVESYFGTPTDIDDNGKLVVFVSPITADSIAAFVWSGDFFTKASCPPSNEMEIIYFNADLVRAVTDADPSFQALGTMAHETKHVVSLYNRIVASTRAGGSRFHPSWIEEGTAEIAAEMSSRVAWSRSDGPALGSAVIRDDFVRSGAVAENYGVLLMMARSVRYLSSQPNGIVVTPDGAAQGHDIRGSGWHFHRWLGDAYGNAATPRADSALFRALNDSLAPQGTNGILQEIGDPFPTLLEGFATAISLHRTGAPEPDARFTSYDFVTATDILANQPPGVYPWPVTASDSVTISASFESGTYAGRIGPTGLRIHDLISNGTGTGAQIALDMEAPGRIVVVRIR